MARSNTLQQFVLAVAQAHRNAPEGSDTLSLDRKLAVEAAKRVGGAIKAGQKKAKPRLKAGSGRKRGPKIKRHDRAAMLHRGRMALHRETKKRLAQAE